LFLEEKLITLPPSSNKNEKPVKTEQDFSRGENGEKLVIEPTRNKVSDSKTRRRTIKEVLIELDKELVADLLNQVKDCSPKFFEKLVLDLLLKMGYGNFRKNAGQVTGRSGDEGIDGTIHQDALGLDTIYIQAKRWAARVPIETVRGFTGALEGQKGKKGILITTSDYPETAYAHVSGITNKIILIDGRKLVELMVEYKIGLQVNTTFEIKKIDTDYFKE
jgi:restriction system protein